MRPTGGRHIVDVKTGEGIVLEFQHSPLEPEEMRSRESFYGRLVWVVDGTRGPHAFLEKHGASARPRATTVAEDVSGWRARSPGRSANSRASWK